MLDRFSSLKPVHDIRVTLSVDQGSQYIARKFRERAEELGVKIEYCAINYPDDKPYVESFFFRYKCEEFSAAMTIILLVMLYWGGCGISTGIK